MKRYKLKKDTPAFKAGTECYIKEAGNYFESREEAEKSVERLKAWERLKGAGLKFKDWNKSNYDRTFCINAEVGHDVVASEFFKDLIVALDMEIGNEAQK